MSQADELLEYITSESSDTGRIVIGADRFVHVPEALKRIAVQYDHNIETVTFECPRYLNGHDIATMQIYVNYIRADGIKGSHRCTNIIIDEATPDVVYFDWTISGHATYVDGRIEFVVCIKMVDSEGEEVIHWNSEINSDMYVSPGIKHLDMTMAKYPDVIAQLFTRIEALEAAITSSMEEG